MTDPCSQDVHALSVDYVCRDFEPVSKYSRLVSPPEGHGSRLRWRLFDFVNDVGAACNQQFNVQEHRLMQCLTPELSINLGDTYKK